MKKLWIALLPALVLCLLCGAAASADTTYYTYRDSDGVEWTYTGDITTGEATIVSCISYQGATAVTMPDTIPGIMTFTVTGFNANVFVKNSWVTSVMIGNNVTAIQRSSFKNCPASRP